MLLLGPYWSNLDPCPATWTSGNSKEPYKAVKAIPSGRIGKPILLSKNYKLNVMLEQLYQDRAAGVLLEQEFHTLLARNREERAQWEILYKQAQAISKQENIQRDYAEEIRQFLAFKAVDRATVLSLLERVLIHEDKTVELIFRVCDPN